MSERRLNILMTVIDISNSALSVDEKLKGILDLLSKELGVDNSNIYIIDPGLKFISEKASNSGRDSGEETRTYKFGSGIIGLCASTTKPIVIDDISNATVSELVLLDEADRYSSFAAIPVEDGRVYGVLYLSNEKPMGLEERDLLTLHAVCSLIAAILRESRLYLKAEKVVREFSILYDISTAMMTTIKLDRLLHIILTAVTIGDGLGFNRAILFLVNERSDIIQGMMGVGPDTHEEAWRAWAEYSTAGKGLLDIIFSSIKEGEIPSSRLSDIVKSIRLPLDSPYIVSRTVREQRPFNVSEQDEEHTVSDELFEKLGMSSFASVPLMASGKVVGVILVDNYFNKKPITDDDIKFLTMFANQAGLAIENSLLYSDVNEANLEIKETHERLLQSEKLAALGEMAANVAHEIRNPLTSLGGFARRLYKRLEGHTEKKYAEIMVKEVERLEKLLTDILVLSRKSTAPFKKQDINKILDSTLLQLGEELKGRRIDLKKEFQEGLPKIDCDSQQLKQVFINLLTNAVQAMDNEGVLTVATYRITEGKAGYVGVAVTDTGGGISEKSLPNIFNPFFTTKDTGTGLGLSISHRIVAHHHGEIEVINRPEQGVTFIVKLPASITEPEEEDI